MIKKLVFTLMTLSTLWPPTHAQSNIDTRGLDYYISIAESIQEGKIVPASLWDSLFTTPYFDLAINKVRFTTKNDVQKQMTSVYTPSTSLNSAQQQQLRHHLEYKKNLQQLKTYARDLHTGSLQDTLAKYLYPYLPEQLQNKALIPVIVISFFHGEEANGLEDMILQDALLSCKMDSYQKGLLSAHEAFHSIVTKALRNRATVNLDQVSTPAIVTNMLSAIAQEGVADLIDKDVFSAPGSPMYETIANFTANEDNISPAYIRSLDSALVALSKNDKIKNPAGFSRNIMGFGGHQPGRYMARIIRDAGLLPELVADVENPFTFIYTYNKSVQQLGKPSPQFTEKSIQWLQQLEAKTMKPTRQ